MTRRVGGLVLGWTLILLGLAALVLPGPGLLLLAAGLAVLSQQYEWAERRVEPVRDKAYELAETSVRSWGTITLTVVLTLGLMATGVIWGARPPPPEWWSFDERWWLPGGWGTGSSLVGSGLVAIGLLIYSYRRFRSHRETRTGEESSGDRSSSDAGR